MAKKQPNKPVKKAAPKKVAVKAVEAKPMNARQRAFADSYLLTGNATTSYKEIYQVSENVARAAAARMLANVSISDYIKSKQSKVADKYDVSLERVVKEYARLAFSDIRNYYTEDGGLKNIVDLDEDAARALSNVESLEEKEWIDGVPVPVGISRKIKIYDKRAALDSLCKVLGYNAPEKAETTLHVNWTEEKSYDK